MKTFTLYLKCPMRDQQFVDSFYSAEQAQECIERRKPQLQRDAEAAYGKGEFSVYGRGWKLYCVESKAEGDL